jgi:hypothetical protein
MPMVSNFVDGMPMHFAVADRGGFVVRNQQRQRPRLRLTAFFAAAVMIAGNAGAAIVSYNRDSTVVTPAETEEPSTYVFTNTGTPSSINATVPSNSSTDLANGITPVLLLGTAHSLSAPITKLTDGPGALNNNDINNNFFFADATTEGRIRISLSSPQEIGRINTYSWASGGGNNGLRAPQKYEVYAAGALTPAQLADDATDITDYTLIATVNAEQGNVTADNGQWGVSISPNSGFVLGTYQNFVFRIFDGDRALAASGANEFYSESTSSPRRPSRQRSACWCAADCS